MATGAVPFQHLAERIQKQEAELAKLRKELEARHNQLSELTLRKQKLQAELADIEQHIDAVHTADITIQEIPSRQKSHLGGGPDKSLSLPKYLIELVRQAGQPMTTAQLIDAVVANQYPTTSSKIADIVKTRVYDLVKKGLLCRVNGTAALVLPGANGPTPVSKGDRPKSAIPVGRPVRWRSLHEVLTYVLSQSDRPLNVDELADCVQDAGYQSTSKDFKNVLWSSLGKLPNAERIPGKGYRLKKTKVSRNA